MDKIYLLHPHYIKYPSNLVALEMAFKILNRETILMNGPYTTGETVAVQGRRHHINDIFLELKGIVHHG
jgi:hypothetical protein